MKKNFIISILMTLVTTILLGLVYPLIITAFAQVLFKDKANGQLITKNGEVVGSRIIGQAFVGPGYFHSRPSAAGNGYDGANSGGSNYGPTNQKLIDRIQSSVSDLQKENPGTPIPADLVTTSASGLDPDISPAAANFQAPRIAMERKVPQDSVMQLIQRYTSKRELGFIGEPRVNVLELNLALDSGSNGIPLSGHP